MEKQCKRYGEGEQGKIKTHYRTSRYFCVNGEWFFSTREGAQIGPYSSKFEAEAGAGRYIEHMKISGNEGVERALQIAKEGNWKFNNFC